MVLDLCVVLAIRIYSSWVIANLKFPDEMQGSIFLEQILFRLIPFILRDKFLTFHDPC